MYFSEEQILEANSIFVYKKFLILPHSRGFVAWSSSLESPLVSFSLHIALKIFREPSFLLISEFCNHFIIVDSLTRFGGDFLQAEAENLVPLEDLVSLTQNFPSGVYQMTACLRDKTLQSNMAPAAVAKLPVLAAFITDCKALFSTSGVMVGPPLNGSVDCVPVAGKLNFPELEASKVFVFENEVPSISSSTPKLLRAVGSADPVVSAVIPFVISPGVVDFITFVTAMVSVFDVVVGAFSVVKAVVSVVVVDKATAAVVDNAHDVAADNVVVGVPVAIAVVVAFGSEGAALLSPVGLCSSSLLFCHSLLTKTITVEIKI
uniref:Uncharacterized protein n=1 Tax=Glossina austeni TaxID=7395 RepID=A0A1A9UWW1_GLOAU